jgi:hypothetical protein
MCAQISFGTSFGFQNLPTKKLVFLKNHVFFNSPNYLSHRHGDDRDGPVTTVTAEVAWRRGGLGRRPQHGLRITTRYPASPPTTVG